jgi:hypothetical protein
LEVVNAVKAGAFSEKEEALLTEVEPVLDLVEDPLPSSDATLSEAKNPSLGNPISPVKPPVMDTAPKLKSFSEPAKDLQPESDPQEFGKIGESNIGFDEAFDIVYRKVRKKTDSQLLEAVEKQIIKRTLSEMGGNQVKASAILGITRATLRKRIDQYEIRY